MTSVALPRHVRIEHLPELFGSLIEHPRLSWWLPEGASRQVSYQLATESWDSGWVDSSAQVLVPIGGRARKSGQRDEVRVRVRTDAGVSGWSVPVRWETGLLHATDWSGLWISPPEPVRFEAGRRPIYEFVHDFEFSDVEADRSGVSARAYATALGVYELFLNGERVGDLELTPGFTAYGTNLNFQTYDVSTLLRPGTNRITARLSDGWYRGRLGLEREPDGFGTLTAFRMDVVIENPAEQRQVVATSADWRVRALAETADLMDGHTIDRRARPSNWQAVVVRHDRVADPTTSDSPPVRRVQELVPIDVTRLASGSQLVDLGQNISGWSRMSKLGESGSTITLTHGEALGPDGGITMDHLRGFRVATLELLGAGQVDTVVSDGDATATFESRHSTKGFRYIEIDGHSETLTTADVTGIVVHTDLERTGRFECSDDRINRLYEAAVWSLRSNVCDIPTDCPQRERSGFTGDWQIYAPTAAFLFDVAAFTRKWLRDLAADQWADGRVPTITPDPAAGSPSGTTFDAFVGSAGWGDAAVLVPWSMWLAYGDRQFLEEQYESMVGWVRFAAGRAAGFRHPDRAAARPVALDHEQFLWDIGFHFGEWLEPGEVPRPDPTADHGAVATAYLHLSSRTLADVARILGRDADAAEFGALAAGSRMAWQAEYLKSDGSLFPETQANHVRALRFGLVPDHLRGIVADHLADLVKAKNGHLSTGFLSTADLLPILAEHGHLDVAYELLTASGYPSWMEMLDRGATTIWEHWDGIDEHGTPRASLNHYSKGAVISFLHTVTAGIRLAADGSQESAGYRRFVIAPQPGGGLTWAEATHDGPYGTIRARWELANAKYSLTVTVPAGSSARVVLPGDSLGAAREVGPGDHRFSWPADRP